METQKKQIEKTKQRSLEIVPFSLPAYNAGGRTGPPAVKTVEIDLKSPVCQAWHKNLLWIIHTKRIADIPREAICCSKFPGIFQTLPDW